MSVHSIFWHFIWQFTVILFGNWSIMFFGISFGSVSTIFVVFWQFIFSLDFSQILISTFHLRVSNYFLWFIARISSFFRLLITAFFNLFGILYDNLFAFLPFYLANCLLCFLAFHSAMYQQFLAFYLTISCIFSLDFRLHFKNFFLTCLGLIFMPIFLSGYRR